jgi:hypothetical protein
MYNSQIVSSLTFRVTRLEYTFQAKSFTLYNVGTTHLNFVGKNIESIVILNIR